MTLLELLKKFTNINLDDTINFTFRYIKVSDLEYSHTEYTCMTFLEVLDNHTLRDLTVDYFSYYNNILSVSVSLAV